MEGPHVLLHRPHVEELNAVFVSDWYSETNQLLLAEINTDIPYAGDGMRAQVVPSGPGFETETTCASSTT